MFMNHMGTLAESAVAYWKKNSWEAAGKLLLCVHWESLQLKQVKGLSALAN